MDYSNAMKAKSTIDLVCYTVDKMTADNEVIKANLGTMKVSNLLRMDFVKFLLSMTKDIECLTDEEYEYLNFIFGVDMGTIRYIYNDVNFSWIDFVRTMPISLQIVSVVEKEFWILASALNEDVESLQSQIVGIFEHLGQDYLNLSSTDLAHKKLVLEYFINNISKRCRIVAIDPKNNK